MEKGEHKLLLYFVAIFILPTLARKLRDENDAAQERNKMEMAGRCVGDPQENCQPQCSL